MSEDQPQDQSLHKAETLDDVMMAMDVVDTLRHREQLVLRELDKDGREAELVERLKEIYTAQGIEVPENILRDGVKALDENRFVYAPPRQSFATRLAKVYVSRRKWGKPVSVAFASLIALLGVWQFGFVMPQKAEARRELVALTETLPAQLEKLRQDAQELAQEERVDTLAETYYQNGMSAVEDGNAAFAKIAAVDLGTLIDDLKAIYEVRVVYGPGEPRSGVFRIPNDDPNARNYYLIVEAVDATGKVLTVPAVSEEDQTTQRTQKWGLRVTEEAFYKVAQDKEDDQIIQNAVIGTKKRGFLTPDYLVQTNGGAIFEW
ncbi:MAG: hypothetical protein CME88_08395 [Hirschia sp.]|nr:hypothetical protein [Hirschia sp.]